MEGYTSASWSQFLRTLFNRFLSGQFLLVWEVVAEAFTVLLSRLRVCSTDGAPMSTCNTNWTWCVFSFFLSSFFWVGEGWEDSVTMVHCVEFPNNRRDVMLGEKNKEQEKKERKHAEVNHLIGNTPLEGQVPMEWDRGQ